MPIIWKHRVCLFSLLRFFDVIIDRPFFDVVKGSAIESKEASKKETDTAKERGNIYYLNQKMFGDSNKELDIK